MIQNYPLNTEDSIKDSNIYGPDRPILQGGMKICRKPAERVPRVPLKKIYRCITGTSKSILILLYKQNAFPTYKAIQYHFPHSRTFYFKERGQYHQIIEHSPKHLQGKRLQHIRVPQRQQFQPKCFERAHTAGEFKHLCKRITYSHHLEVHKKHQERSALNHTLCAIQEIHKSHDKITGGMYNPIKTLIYTERQHQK